LLACFEDAAGENLKWFWQPWMNEIGYADLALNVDKEKFAKQGKVIVKKIGRLPAPISLKISYNDGSSENILQKASIWATKNEVTIKVNNPKNVKSLILDYTLTPDAFPENNTIQF
jgi:aminopeptidase N